MRQHALRVLVDLIAVLVSSGVAAETIANLGHAAPAVRQTATEALATQLRRTSDPEGVLRAVVEQGLEGQQQGQGPLGTILALPGLLSRAMHAHPGWTPTPQGVAHLVGALAGRLVQVTYQPHAQVYERSNEQHDDEQGVDWNGNEHADKGDFSSGESTTGADVAVNVVAVQQADVAPPGRVVMETEIKFDADTAITSSSTCPLEDACLPPPLPLHFPPNCRAPPQPSPVRACSLHSTPPPAPRSLPPLRVAQPSPRSSPAVQHDTPVSA